MANLTNTHASQTLGLHDLKTIPNDPVPRDEAIYLASLSPGFCEDIQNNQPARALPAGLAMATTQWTPSRVWRDAREDGWGWARQ